MTLDKLFHHGADAAKHLFEVQSHLLPMWLGISDRGGHVPLMVPDFGDKDAASEAVRKFLKKNNIVRYVSMLECWTYRGMDMPQEILEGKSLENNPDRREAIHVLAEDRDGGSMSGQYYILRPEHGKPTLSPLKVYEKADRTEGRFVNMFT